MGFGSMGSGWRLGRLVVSSANDNVAIVGESLARGLFSMCGSPIEESLLATLICFNGQDLFKPVFGKAGVVAQCKDWLLMCQHPFEQYMLDFAIVSNAGKIAVECDGHEYHERTREQAMHDRSRDRKCQLAGWKVLRFTGSEIHRDVRGCVKQVLQMMAMADGCEPDDYMPKVAHVSTIASPQCAPEYRFGLAIIGCLLDFPDLSEDLETKVALTLLTSELADIAQEIRNYALLFDRPEIGDFIARLPQTVQRFVAGRLACPVFETAIEAKANIQQNAAKLESLYDRQRGFAKVSLLERSASSYDADGEAALRDIAQAARKRRGL